MRASDTGTRLCHGLIGLGLLLAPAAVAPGAPAETGTIEGELLLPIDGMSLADAAPFVVYLDAFEGQLAFEPPADVALISQVGARFSPPLLVVTVGQTVELRNDDEILHNVFSYSRPNHFDVGIYPKGESRFRPARAPGVVRIYCAMHESMNGTIFVSPSPYYDQVGSSGEFRLAAVPPDRYRLRVWSRQLPEVEREVTVSAGVVTRISVDLGAGRSGPAAANRR